jgi:hypothetical protein
MDIPGAEILLCDKCQHLVDHFYFRYITHPRLTDTPTYEVEHHSFHDLEAHATKVCRLCQCFIRSFEDRGTSLQQLREQWGDAPSTLGFTGSQTLSLEFGCGLILQWGEAWDAATYMGIVAVSPYGMRKFQ